MFLVLSCNRDKVRCAARYTACGGIQLLSSRVEFRCGVQMMVDAAGPNVGQENVPMHHHSSHQTSNESIHNVYENLWTCLLAVQDRNHNQGVSSPFTSRNLRERRAVRCNGNETRKEKERKERRGEEKERGASLLRQYFGREAECSGQPV